MNFQVSAHHNAHAGPRAQTFGLFAPNEHVGNQQVQIQSAPSHIPDSPLNASDPLSGLLSILTLGGFTPQVPVQPQQAVEQVEHADAHDKSQGSVSFKLEALNYQRALESRLRESVDQPLTFSVERWGDYPDML
ncbi:hypothetical protein FRC08_000698 [Ceratobasidium sp. 394]|nr:hypothetical protein FRC08_000698 [Ceratobasidium sp. 394]